MRESQCTFLCPSYVTRLQRLHKEDSQTLSKVILDVQVVNSIHVLLSCIDTAERQSSLPCRLILYRPIHSLNSVGQHIMSVRSNAGHWASVNTTFHDCTVKQLHHSVTGDAYLAQSNLGCGTIFA